jgi:hypothetical protein
LEAGGALISFLSLATMDSRSWGIAWCAIVVMPIAAVVLLWMVHVPPENGAERRYHLQKDDICLLPAVNGVRRAASASSP